MPVVSIPWLGATESTTDRFLKKSEDGKASGQLLDRLHHQLRPFDGEMASWLGFQPTVDTEIRFLGEQDRESVEVKVDKDRKEHTPVYLDGESVAGQVRWSSPLTQAQLNGTLIWNDRSSFE